MQIFSKIWSTEVKPLAEACLIDDKIVQLLTKGEDYQPTESEMEYLNNIANKYKDVPGIPYIYDMIIKVEHALADNKKDLAMLAITHVYTVLNSPSYFQRVFNSDENNEEWQTRKALRDGLSKLIYA